MEINPNLTVGETLANFYAVNNFGDEGGIHEPFVWIKFGFFSVPIPNMESRKSIVYLHDINHLISDNDTTWRGESAVSAWEMGAGGWYNLYTPLFLTLWAMGLGVVFYPKTVWQSFQRGLTMSNALTSGLSKTELYQLTVAELREKLSNQPHRNRSAFAWMFISFLVFIAPFVVGVLMIFAILQCF